MHPTIPELNVYTELSYEYSSNATPRKLNGRNTLETKSTWLSIESPVLKTSAMKRAFSVLPTVGIAGLTL